MARPIVALIAAGLSTLVHLCLTIITILGIILELNMRNNADNSDDSGWPAFSGLMLVLLVLALIVEITVLVSSICLIIGIQKNRLAYVVSWLYVVLAYMILSFVDFILGYNALGYLFPIKLAVFILHLIILYPIFKFWRDLRSRSIIKAPANVENVESSMYPQLGEVEYSRKLPAEEQEKHHSYAPLK